MAPQNPAVMQTLAGADASTPDAGTPQGDPGAPPNLQDQLPMIAQQPQQGGTAQYPMPPTPQGPAPAPAAPGPRPGSFGWKLAETLKGVTEGLRGMGDAAAVGTTPPGAGWLYGVNKTLGARNERLKQEQERKDKLAQEAKTNTREDWNTWSSIATANIQRRNEQYVTSQHGEEARDRSIKEGESLLDSWENSPVGAVQSIQTKVGASKIKAVVDKLKGMTDDNGKPLYDILNLTAVPDGKRVVGEDPETHMPQYETTYSIVPVPQNYKLKPEDKEWVDRLNSHTSGKKWVVPEADADGNETKPGDSMPGYVAHSLWQQSQNLAAMDTGLAQANRNRKIANESLQFENDGTWMKYMSDPRANGDMSKAAQLMREDYAANRNGIRDKVPDLDQVLDSTLSYMKTDTNGKEVRVGGLERLEEDRKLRIEEMKAEFTQLKESDPVYKFQSDPKQYEGAASSSAVEVLKGLLQSDPMSGNKAPGPQRQVQIKAELEVAQHAYDKWIKDQEHRVQYAQQLKDGDPVELGKLLARNALSWEEAKTRFTTGKDVVAMATSAETEYKRLHPGSTLQWSAENLKKWGQRASASTNNAFFGGANTLLKNGGTIDQLLQVRKQIPDNQFPPINKFEDIIELEGSGNAALAQYASIAAGIAMDYARVEGGGSTTIESINQGQELVKAMWNSKQLAASTQGIRDSVRSYRDNYAGDNPFLQDEITIGESVPPPGSDVIRDKNTKKPIGYVLNGTRYNF